MKPMIKTAILSLIGLGLIGATAAWYQKSGNANTDIFQTAKVTRGDLRITISATGTVEPEEVIDVGAQVAGQILSFGRDANGKTVDYGSVVEEGTILARIDDSVYSAEAASARAQVQSARAGLQRAEADLNQLKAKLHQASRDWQRAQKIGPSEALAQASYDAYQSNYETAKANVAVGDAAILQAKAGLAQAQAELQRAQRNLGYCTIKSPVKGVIIDRRVNIGQTVVASLNAPSLFLIAKDLTRMQVWVAVNEADIGKIHPGQPVTFTVDAFPGETFQGVVGKVRLNASMTQNVVTYTVEIVTDNANGLLLPYLTANVQFELQHLSNVLLVPNAALRWNPKTDQIAPDFRKALQQSGPKPDRASAKNDRDLVWALQGEYVRPIVVRAGLSDGVMTQIQGQDLSVGLDVVTGLRDQKDTSSDTRNPFTPQFLRRSRNQGSR
ncbi:MAG: efflux RND transporter periplasmic adaptor subunit [Desulfobacterales bacterium]